MTTDQTVILSLLKEQLETNDFSGPYQQNVWIMAAAINYLGKLNTPNAGAETPTHVVRLILRTTDEAGTNDYVDGSDVYVKLDQENKIVNLVWEDLWAEGPPIFHGGTIPDALRWVRELADPFYVQLRDPFLTPDQWTALNGHDNDFVEPQTEQPHKYGSVPLKDDDFDAPF